MNTPINDALGASQATSSSERSEVPDTRLRGRRLVLARVAWVAAVSLLVALFLATLPANYTLLQTVCTGATCGSAQPTPASAQALQKLGLSVGTYATFTLALTLALAFVCFTLGAVIFWRRSDDWMALLVALAVVASVTLNGSGAYGMNFAWRVLANVLIVLGGGVSLLAFALFPDGRFVPRWTRWLLLCWVVAGLVFLFFPDASFASSFYDLVFHAEVVLLLIAQVYRSRTAASPLQRQQGKWMVFGGCVVVIIAVGLSVLPFLFPSLGQAGSVYQLVTTPVFSVILLILPLFLGLAILRFRLWDIDLIIHRTLLYGMLTVCVVALYVLVVVGLGALLQTKGNLGLSLLATGLIAVLIQPLHTRLQRAVNHLLYGERDEPYTVISRLGQRLEATLAPEAVLPTIVETVTQALKLPYAAISLKRNGEDVMTASSGRASDELARLPLIYQGEHIGDLLLAPRARGETFSPADQTLLASLNWRAGALRLLLVRDPVAADALVVEQQTTIQAALGDIRRLVYDLRPPALDELGLVGAIRERAAKQYTPTERDSIQGLCIDVVAPDQLPALPAAIEVAAYRIVQEALANVVRHAQAHRCCICLSCEQEMLHVEVSDDGIGLPESYRAGVGLLSLRERTAELGGTCKIARMPEGGTCVQACLPRRMHDQQL